MKPTIGRTVHFRGANRDGSAGDVYAAIITAVHENGTVDLVTFGPNSVYFQHNVPQDDHPQSAEPLAGCWSWPPRV